MPKETENLEATGEFTEQPELPAAETEEADGQTDAAWEPVSENAEDPPAEAMEAPKPKRTRRKKAAVEETDHVPALKHRRPHPQRKPCRPVKSRPLGPLFQNQIPRRRVPRQS